MEAAAHDSIQDDDSYHNIFVFLEDPDPLCGPVLHTRDYGRARDELCRLLAPC